jgi:hypothetical protein
MRSRVDRGLQAGAGEACVDNNTVLGDALRVVELCADEIVNNSRTEFCDDGLNHGAFGLWATDCFGVLPSSE